MSSTERVDVILRLIDEALDIREGREGEAAATTGFAAADVADAA